MLKAECDDLYDKYKNYCEMGGFSKSEGKALNLNTTELLHKLIREVSIGREETEVLLSELTALENDWDTLPENDLKEKLRIYRRKIQSVNIIRQAAKNLDKCRELRETYQRLCVKHAYGRKFEEHKFPIDELKKILSDLQSMEKAKSQMDDFMQKSKLKLAEIKFLEAGRSADKERKRNTRITDTSSDESETEEEEEESYQASTEKAYEAINKNLDETLEEILKKQADEDFDHLYNRLLPDASEEPERYSLQEDRITNWKRYLDEILTEADAGRCLVTFLAEVPEKFGIHALIALRKEKTIYFYFSPCEKKFLIRLQRCDMGTTVNFSIMPEETPLQSMAHDSPITDDPDTMQMGIWVQLIISSSTILGMYEGMAQNGRVRYGDFKTPTPSISITFTRILIDIAPNSDDFRNALSTSTSREQHEIDKSRMIAKFSPPQLHCKASHQPASSSSGSHAPREKRKEIDIKRALTLLMPELENIKSLNPKARENHIKTKLKKEVDKPDKNFLKEVLKQIQQLIDSSSRP